MKGVYSQRIFGLDVLRAVAILIVVLEHSLSLLSEQNVFLNNLALPDGVDLFFVLSGFLIGNKLIESIEKNNGFNRFQLSSFLKRRWLRTLPNYFLFLFLNLALIHFSLIPGEINAYTPSYFLFLQNFHKPFDFMFWESWSLSVEEWFYVLFPLFLFFLFRLPSGILTTKNRILSVIGLFILAPLLYRWFSAYGMPDALDWDLYYRKLVLCRLDAMGYGLLAAFGKIYCSRLWNSIKKIGFVFGLCLLSVFVLYSLELQNSYWFSRTLYFSFYAISVMALLPMLNSLKTETLPFASFSFISRISYSMYLIHLPLLHLFQNTRFLAADGIVEIRYASYWVLVLLLSFLVYKYFEKPILDFKENQTKMNTL